MRIRLLFALGLLALLELSVISCDNDEVKVDDVKTVMTDSVTIPVFASVADTSMVVLKELTNADRWHAEMVQSGNWCSLSKTDGIIGDTLFIYVKENTNRMGRYAWLKIEAGTLIMQYLVRQNASKK
jgi:hypothetical protein